MYDNCLEEVLVAVCVMVQGGQRPLEPLENPGKPLEGTCPWKKPWNPLEEDVATPGKIKYPWKPLENLNFGNYVDCRSSVISAISQYFQSRCQNFIQT